MKTLESPEAVTHTHTHTHDTFYKNTKVSNTVNGEAVLGYSQKFNKYKIKIEML